MTKAQKRKLEAIMEKLDELYTELEELKDTEQGKLDNMAESFGETQRYAEMEESVSKMEDALEAIEDAKDSIEEACA